MSFKNVYCYYFVESVLIQMSMNVMPLTQFVTSMPTVKIMMDLMSVPVMLDIMEMGKRAMVRLTLKKNRRMADITRK